jgi:hypothetical protein
VRRIGGGMCEGLEKKRMTYEIHELVSGEKNM